MRQIIDKLLIQRTTTNLLLLFYLFLNNHIPFNHLPLWRPSRDHPVRDRRMPIPQVQKKGKKLKVCDFLNT